MTDPLAPGRGGTPLRPEETGPAPGAQPAGLPAERESATPARAGRARVVDVAVVGAGIGGLAAAALLARAGRSVVLVERAGEVGGACRPIVQDGYRFDLGASLLVGAGSEDPLATLLGRLGIDLPRMTSDPTLQVALPRHRLTFFRDTRHWWRELRREVPEDEPRWRSLLADLASLVRDREQIMRTLPPAPPQDWREQLRFWAGLARQYLSTSARQAVGRLRDAERTPFRSTLAKAGLGSVSRQALEACLWYLVIRDLDECSTLEAALALHKLSAGAMGILGGPMALANALADSIRQDGGEIRLETEVGACLAERGRLCGVVTAAGEAIRARFVVADVPPPILSRGLSSKHRRRFFPGRTAEEPWRPLAVVQSMALVIPERYLPSEMGGQCLVVQNAGLSATGENLAFMRLSPGRATGQTSGDLRCLSVGRFVSSSAPAEAESLSRSLLSAVEQIAPGLGDVAIYRAVFPPEKLGEWLGRPFAGVRYAPDSQVWWGGRGLSNQTRWPDLLAVGEWTQPGRLISHVVEGAIGVADRIAKAG